MGVWVKGSLPSVPQIVIAKIAEAVAIGLTDREAGLLAGVRHDTMTEWRKDPEFSEAVEKATAQRLLLRLERIEAGWQGTAWALERLHSSRFARPEAQFAQPINVNTGRPRGSGIILDPGGAASAKRCI